ncbi:MAG: recombinase RecT [Vicinamibacteria bacterium]
MATDTGSVPAGTKPPANDTKKALTPLEEVRRTLLSDAMKAQLVMALPPQMPPEKFQRVAITAVNQNPDLLNCSRESLYGAFMRAAQDGLLPDGREAAIVRYNTKSGPTATYMPMVGGILKKVRNSGELAAITAQLIYKQDDFRYWVDDTGEHLEHKPVIFGDRGELMGVYALAKTKDGAVYIEVMRREDVEKVRDSSRAKDSGPWVQWWGEMAKKTAIRRLSKRLPMSTDLDEIIRRDDDLYDLEKPEIDPKANRPTTPTRLQKMLGEPGKVIEGTARDVTPPPAEAEAQPETETELVSGANLPVAGAASSDEPLVAVDADQAPAGEMSEEERRRATEREQREAGAFTCADCGHNTNDPKDMEAHRAKAHGSKPEVSKTPPKGATGQKPGGKGLFG